MAHCGGETLRHPGAAGWRVLVTCMDCLNNSDLKTYFPFSLFPAEARGGASALQVPSEAGHGASSRQWLHPGPLLSPKHPAWPWAPQCGCGCGLWPASRRLPKNGVSPRSWGVVVGRLLHLCPTMGSWVAGRDPGSGCGEAGTLSGCGGWRFSCRNLLRLTEVQDTCPLGQGTKRPGGSIQLWTGCWEQSPELPFPAPSAP